MSNISNKQNLINKIRWHSSNVVYQEDIFRWKSELDQLESQELIQSAADCYEKFFNIDEEKRKKFEGFEIKRKDTLDCLRAKLQTIKENGLSDYSTDEARQNLNKLIKTVNQLIKLDTEYVHCNKLIEKYLERMKI